MRSVRKFGARTMVIMAAVLVTALSVTTAGSTTPTRASMSASATERPPAAFEPAQPQGPVSLATVDFATAQDGAVIFTRALSGDTNLCAVEAAVTTDGGRSFRPSIVLARTEYGLSPVTDCGFASLALAPGGSGWAVAAGRLWAISDAWRTWRVSPAFALALGRESGRLAACGVVLHGTFVLVTACPSDQTFPSFLMRSTNLGRTWIVSRITASAGGSRGGRGSQMAFSSSSTGAVFGCPTETCLQHGGSSSLELSTTDNAGESWVNHRVCPDSDNGGFLAAFASELTVACLGPMSAGAQAITVFSSNNGGRSWREMCANGFFGSWKKRAMCPWEGYVSSLVATSDGTLLMGVTRAGVYASTNDGATWRLTLQTFNFDAGWPVDVASIGDAAWAVTGYGSTLGASTNGGRSWTVWTFRTG